MSLPTRRSSTVPAGKQSRSVQGVAPPVRLPAAATMRPSRHLLNRRPFDRPPEDDARVIQLFLARRNVQNESSESESDITGHLSSYFGVVPDQVRAEGLVVMERDQPVWIVFQSGAELGELLMPDGIRGFHRQLVSQLSFAVDWKALVSHAPGFIFIFTGDNPDSHAGINRLISRLVLVLSGRFGIFDRNRSHRFCGRQSGL